MLQVENWSRPRRTFVPPSEIAPRRLRYLGLLRRGLVDFLDFGYSSDGRPSVGQGCVLRLDPHYAAASPTGSIIRSRHPALSAMLSASAAWKAALGHLWGRAFCGSGPPGKVVVVVPHRTGADEWNGRRRPGRCRK